MLELSTLQRLENYRMAAEKRLRLEPSGICVFEDALVRMLQRCRDSVSRRWVTNELGRLGDDERRRRTYLYT